MSEMNPFTSTF